MTVRELIAALEALPAECHDLPATAWGGEGFYEIARVDPRRDDYPHDSYTSVGLDD